VSEFSVLHVAPDLALDSVVNDSLNYIRAALNLLLDLAVDLAEESRERSKDSRLQLFHVFD
jgi:hypothetical protein